jgi:selenide,water dikinase
MLVRMDTSEDAGVYRLDGDTALVQTLDVITPIVDDPWDFGYIAVINALSDVYAMGGTPLTAMTFLAFEACRLPLEGASLILEGALKALEEASCALVGGHTIEDPEIKFGVSVTGTIHPDRIVTNSGARAGDLVYLTKPLGTGIASTALKGEMLSPELEAGFIEGMKASNGPASAVMVKSGVSAATDVTGFGLLGHFWEMCLGAGLGAVVNLGSVPLLPGTGDLVGMGLIPAGAYRNRDHLSAHMEGKDVPEESLLPLFDPQTSGGLLIAVQPDLAGEMERRMNGDAVPWWRIGEFCKGDRIRIEE